MKALSLVAALFVSGAAFTTSTDKLGTFQTSDAASVTVSTSDRPSMRRVTRERVIVHRDRGRHLGWERGRHRGWDNDGGRRVVKRTITRHSDGSVSRTTVRRSMDD